jgi:hypothetical protein
MRPNCVVYCLTAGESLIVMIILPQLDMLGVSVVWARDFDNGRLRLCIFVSTYFRVQMHRRSSSAMSTVDSQNFNLEGNRVTSGKNTNSLNPSNMIKLQYFFIQYIMDSTDQNLAFTLLRATLHVLGQNLIVLEGRSIVGAPNLALARELELCQRPSVRTIEQHTGALTMPPANMGPQEKKIWLAQERQKAGELHKRKLELPSSRRSGRR